MIQDFLPTPNGSPIMQAMVQVIRKVAKLLIHDFGELEQLQTAPNSIERFVDKSISNGQKQLCEQLFKIRPSFGIIRGDNGHIIKAGHETNWVFWTIDGIDNYSHGLTHFSTALMVYKNDFPIAGIVYNPLNDEMFCVEHGRGAYAFRRRLRVSRRTTSHGLLLASSWDLRRFFDLKDCTLRISGTPLMDLAYTAAGRYDLTAHSFNWYEYFFATLFSSESGGMLHQLPQETASPLAQFPKKIPHHEEKLVKYPYVFGHEVLIKKVG